MCLITSCSYIFNMNCIFFYTATKKQKQSHQGTYLHLRYAIQVSLDILYIFLLDDKSSRLGHEMLFLRILYTGGASLNQVRVYIF